MAAGVNQKQRMLYLERLFKETDRNNALTLVEIVQRLQAARSTPQKRHCATTLINCGL